MTINLMSDSKKFLLLIAALTLLSAVGHAAPPSSGSDTQLSLEAGSPDAEPETIETLAQEDEQESDGEPSSGRHLTEQAAQALRELHIYGYFSTRYETPFSVPDVIDGEVVDENPPGEWSFPSFHLMFQSQIGKQFRIFVNINGDDADDINLRNMWGEYNVNRSFTLRAGKSYRRFGLYNEILDAVPSYLGVEPPELFDSDHLIVSRTTTLMAHGSTDLGSGTFNYSVSTDNGEGDRIENTVPLGFDLNWESGLGNLVLGLSAYTSNGETTSDVGVGEGSPKSGVLPWMQTDDFNVFGGYVESIHGGFSLQAEYWRSSHDGVRNPSAILTLVDEAGLNPRQMSRFLIDPSGPAVPENVRTVADYEIETWYVRTGYSFSTKYGEVVPYLFWDWYSNPETIESKTYGGDNEAGASDDGEFDKPTIGVVFRPTETVAIKLDGSSHIYKLNGENVSYPEIRFDVSFVFGS